MDALKVDARSWGIGHYISFLYRTYHRNLGLNRKINPGNCAREWPDGDSVVRADCFTCNTYNTLLWFLMMSTRWVSVSEFHDGALGIGKVFGQESTVIKWNYQILGLLQVTVHQKLGVILVIKWFKNWSQQKLLFTKKVRLNWYSSMKFFFERFGWFLT